jgi:hypothetical protein
VASEGDDGEDVARRIAEARRALVELRSGARGTDEPVVAVRGVGEAADGLVRVIAEGARLRAVMVDGQLLRGSPAWLVSDLVTAVNTALAGTGPGDAGPEEPAPNLDVLRGQLGEVLEQSLMAQHRIAGALDAAFAQIRQKAVVRGDVPGGGELAELLSSSQAMLSSVGGSVQPPVGIGEAPGGRVRAECLTGRVRSLVIHGEGRIGSVELGDAVIAAVNTALDDAEKRGEQAQGPVRDELTAAAQAVQEAGARQMQTYAQTLQSLMNSIEPRT